MLPFSFLVLTVSATQNWIQDDDISLHDHLLPDHHKYSAPYMIRSVHARDVNFDITDDGKIRTSDSIYYNGLSIQEALEHSKNRMAKYCNQRRSYTVVRESASIGLSTGAVVGMTAGVVALPFTMGVSIVCPLIGAATGAITGSIAGGALALSSERREKHCEKHRKWYCVLQSYEKWNQELQSDSNDDLTDDE